MNGDGLTRFARQLLLPEVGESGQRRLLNARVVIIGCGGLGSAASIYLAGAGVGELVLVDDDRVDVTNLHRQILFSDDDVGEYKATAAARFLNTRYPATTATAKTVRAQAEDLLNLVTDSELVLDCSDNFSTRFSINRACIRSARPLVSGAAIRHEGQVASFHPGKHDSPCYRCLYPEPGNEAERCEDAGILPPVVGTIGAMQAGDALAILIGMPDMAWGRLRVYDARRMTWRTISIPRDDACPDCGESP